MASSKPHEDADSEPELLAEDEADEILEEAPDADVEMDSDAEDDGGGEEITLQNDSAAYFDGHKDSVFAIAQHPLHSHIVATGGSEGDADDAPGRGYVLDLSAAGAAQPPVLPPSYAADASSAAAVAATAASAAGSKALQPVFTLEGHTDSITALAFTQPDGAFLVSGGMDGRLRAYAVSCLSPSPATTTTSSSIPAFTFVGEAQETEDISWIEPCPTTTYDAHAVALGAGDGSVWVYAVEPGGLRMVNSYFLHTAGCTAGAWTPDGALLATVSEDGSLHVLDVWGVAAAARGDNGQTVVSLTEADQRFSVEGGLYSVAVAPTGTFLAVGGNGGAIKIVGLPRIGGGEQPQQRPAKGAKTAREAQRGVTEPSGQAGTILASIKVQEESVESLSFSPAPQTLLAAGSVDGSIAVLDTARKFAVRRHIRGAHEDHSVVKVEFVKRAPGAATGWALTSCGLDGVVRRWDLHGGAAGAAGSATAGVPGLVKEWRGHRGDGDGGGVLGFVQGETGERVVTAGDDGIVLVFET
ncbi:hypothetical protein P8C59_009156 [Phyllachora maydis]|uniref:Uncharacterized protein n=1 Tax=Phyllachora maydis TaxID=1825666 RepID=A0AAD9IBW9_9PEZI|nr:hypothetical protein P8C59_009156 [Phyllachora maydis]